MTLTEKLRSMVETCARCGRTVPISEMGLHQAQKCIHKSWDYVLTPEQMDQADRARHLRVA